MRVIWYTMGEQPGRTAQGACGPASVYGYTGTVGLVVLVLYEETAGDVELL